MTRQGAPFPAILDPETWTSKILLNERPVRAFVVRRGHHVWLEIWDSGHTIILERNRGQTLVSLEALRGNHEMVRIPEIEILWEILNYLPLYLIPGVNEPTPGHLGILWGLRKHWRERKDCVSAVLQMLNAYGVTIEEDPKTPWGLMKVLKRRYRG